jgi:hypothetical protein
MREAIDVDGIYATYAEQKMMGKIGTYAERLAINSVKPPTWSERMQAGKILPYNEAIYL